MARLPCKRSPSRSSRATCSESADKNTLKGAEFSICRASCAVEAKLTTGWVPVCASNCGESCSNTSVRFAAAPIMTTRLGCSCRQQVRIIVTNRAATGRERYISERKPDTEHNRVVIVVVMRRGDLEASAERQRQAAMDLESPEYESRRQERLLLAVLLSALPKRGIDLQLRP